MKALDTQAIHAGTPDPRPEGAVVTPIYQSANFLQNDAVDYEGVVYMRLGNTPNHEILQARMAAVEGAEASLVCGSGMSAISATLLGSLSSGDHLIVQRNVYGGTAMLVDNDLPRLGIHNTKVDPARPDTWKTALQPTTRMFYVESASNPLLELADLEAVVAFCREHGLVSVIDNTFMSPVNYRPLEHGFDIVLHSATKYLNGHSDIAAGVVSASRDRLTPIRVVLGHFGGHLDANACFLLERGLKTLGIRVRRQNETALRLARVLADHPAVARVNYPGLPGHPGHERAARLFAGFGGMLSFETRELASADRFLDRVRIAVHAASLGGVESLVVRPARSSHIGLTPEERESLGITDRLVRVSVGIEDPDELIEDFVAALG